MHEVILEGTSNILSSRVLTTYLVQTTMTDYFKTHPSISTQGTPLCEGAQHANHRIQETVFEISRAGWEIRFF